MTPIPQTRHVVRLERTYAAPLARVRAAWTDPALLARWFAPPGKTATVHGLDARPGGQYEITMSGDDGDFTATGVYEEVSERRIVMSWNWTTDPLPNDTTVTIEFHEEGAKTRLVLTHTGFPNDEARGHHEMGWTGILDQLPDAL